MGKPKLAVDLLSLSFDPQRLPKEWFGLYKESGVLFYSSAHGKPPMIIEEGDTPFAFYNTVDDVIEAKGRIDLDAVVSVLKGMGSCDRDIARISESIKAHNESLTKQP